MRTLLLIGTAFLSIGANAMPTFANVQPRAVVPGKATEVKVTGNGFGDDLRLWTSFDATVKLVKRIDAKQAIFQVTASEKANGIGVLRLHDSTGLSLPQLVVIDAMTTTTTTSIDKNKPQLLKLPIAVDSATAGVNSHWFALDAKAGQRLAIEVYAERIGSSADPIIRLLDPKGREVDYADDDDVLGSDAGLVHTTKLAGQYRLELRDVQYRGGQFYRLRVGDFVVWPDLKPSPNAIIEHEPNDTVSEATLLSMGKPAFGHIEKSGALDHFRFTAKKDQWVRFRAYSRSVGSPAYIYLELLNKTGDIIAKANTEGNGQAILWHRLPADSDYILRVEELIRRGGPRYAYQLITGVGNGAFTLKLKTDKNKADRFWAIPGQQVNLPVQVERHGYEGAITLSANQGWSVVDPIKAKAKDATIKITAPKDAKPGELHHLHITGAGEGIGPTTGDLDLIAALRARWPQTAFPPSVLRQIVPVAIIEPTKITVGAVKIKAGGKGKVRITTLRPPPPIGQKAAPQVIAIELKNLPIGVNAPEKINIEAAKNFVEFELTVSPDSKPGKHQIMIVAKSKYRGAEWTHKNVSTTIEILPK